MTKLRPTLSFITAMAGMAASQSAIAQTMATPPATPPAAAPMKTAPSAAPATAGPPAPATAMPPAAAPATTTAATTPVAATVGMMVKDAAGGTVGTVTKVGDGTVTVKTDKHEANLPAASFTAQGGGLAFGMTQMQLNTEIEKQDAAAAALFKVGAKVSGSGGADAGTISALDGETATLKLPSGKVIRIPRSGIGPSADGLVVGMTAAQLDAAASPATKTTTTTTKKTKTKSK